MLRDDLEADAARGLHEHGVAGHHELADERGGRCRVVGGVVLAAAAPSAAYPAAIPAASGPTVTSTSTPPAPAWAPISSWKRASSGPSSSMSPSTATRLPGADAARSSRAARIDIGLAL